MCEEDLDEGDGGVMWERGSQFSDVQGSVEYGDAVLFSLFQLEG